MRDRKIYDPQLWRVLVKVVRFTQLTLTYPWDRVALLRLCHYYDIATHGAFDFIAQVVGDILSQGIALASSTISFDDMVWLPYILNLKMCDYSFICVDEAQDLNKAQLELVLSGMRR